MRIYVADLGHNLLTRSSDVYPLGVANLVTYAEANLRSSVKPEFAIFREPQDLASAIDREPPDVLGLSNYAWNEALSNHFAAYARRRSPGTLTVMGGPNWPLVDSVQEEFLRSLPAVDCYVDGPTYEGERGFLNVLQRWVDAAGREGVFGEPVAGVDWIDPRTGAFVKGGSVERLRDLDEIPSPYLSGRLDPFLLTGYFPMLQIARGCPFSCTFCNSGVAANSRVYAHSAANVKADLLYLARRVPREATLCFADDNFGMYALDEEIADYIGWLQGAHGWPLYIRTTTGKNNGERIVRVMRKARGALPMTAAVQSMNPGVLKTIKRDNIKLATYARIQEELSAMGMQSYGELILCLPGETRESFMKGIEDLLDGGAKRISAHQLMLLHGAELANPDQRARFGFDTRFRVVARNIGNYTGEPVIEVEEMVVATPDFSFQDYLETRVFHLLLTIFHYEGNYEEPFAFARQHGVKAFDLVMRMQEMLPEAPPELRAVIDDFVAESKGEIFPTREACLDWARAHYAELVDGSLGGNLLSKYSMIGRFVATRAGLDFLERVIARALGGLGVAYEAGELRATVDYLRAVALHVPFARTLPLRLAWTTHYNVAAWAAAGCSRPLSAYRFEEPRTLLAEATSETRALIESKIATFGEHPSGLGKFTRTMFARDLRRALESPERPEGAVM